MFQYSSGAIKQFLRIVSGDAVVFSKENWINLHDSFRPLPNCINIVISDTAIPGCITYSKLPDALQLTETKHTNVWVIATPDLIIESLGYAKVLHRFTLDRQGIGKIAPWSLNYDGWIIGHQIEIYDPYPDHLQDKTIELKQKLSCIVQTYKRNLS